MNGSSKIIDEILRILKLNSKLDKFEREDRFTYTVYEGVSNSIIIVKNYKEVSLLSLSTGGNKIVDFIVNFEIDRDKNFKVISITFGSKIYPYVYIGESSNIDNFLSIWADKLRSA